MCLHTLPNRSSQKPQSGLIYRLIMTLQCATVKNSPSKLEGVPEGGGSVYLQQSKFFATWVAIRMTVLCFIPLFSRKKWSKKRRNDKF